MSKGSYSLVELLKELQAAEGIIGQNKNVQVAEKGSSKKSKKKKNAQKSGATSKVKKPKNDEGKSKGKCFTCS